MPGQLTVSLGALRQNYRSICSATRAPSVAGVVKGNAYGIGVEFVVPALVEAGCKVFFVASLNEGLKVRRLATGARIYVLEGPVAESSVYLESDLTPVINSTVQMTRWDTAGEYALHVDSGMQRLGVTIAEAERLLSAGAKPVLLLSHFARADEVDTPYTYDQLNRLQRLRRFGLPMSLSNSAGALHHQVDEDLVRAGIALYGGSPTTRRDDALYPVVRLTGEVLQVRRVSRGTPVGYGGTFLAPEAGRMATVGLGYADGIPRLLSNQGRVFVRGRYCNMVGRVSMDLIHIWLAPGLEVHDGDTVEALGANVLLEDTAALAQTLSYEILTGLDAAGRLERRTVEALL